MDENENKNSSKSGIYMIINPENGKCYIGQTVDLKVRASRHLHDLKIGKHCNRHLQFAYNKANDKNFIFYVAEFCDREFLTVREQFWIDAIGDRRIYNIAPAGGSCLGIKRSEETRARVSAATKGRVQAAHVIEAVRLANSKRVISEETRKKLSIASKSRPGRKKTEEEKRKISESRSKKIEAFGCHKTLIEWGELFGIKADTIYARIKHRWNPESAVSEPVRGTAPELTYE
jgi:group I intron endonuclease